MSNLKGPTPGCWTNREDPPLQSNRDVCQDATNVQSRRVLEMGLSI